MASDGIHPNADGQLAIAKELAAYLSDSVLLPAATQLYGTVGAGMAGYADTNEIRTQQMMQRLYVCGDQGTEASEGNGLIAPRVAACAAHQANKVLQIVCN